MLDYFAIGIVKVIFVPFPTVLATVISPLFFSTNSLHNNSPSPVPFSLLVPLVVMSSSILKSLVRASSEIPTPVSLTAIIILSFSLFAVIDIKP